MPINETIVNATAAVATTAKESFFHFRNIATCKGFPGQVGFFDFGGDCMMSRLFIVILFFVVAFIAKWGGEEMGIEFNKILSWIGGILLYIIIVSITGSYKIAFIAGLVTALALGYGAGAFGFGGGDGGNEYV